MNKLIVEDVDFPKQLDTALKDAGLSPPELARNLGIHASNINKYLRGSALPRPSTVKMINSILFGDLTEETCKNDISKIIEKMEQIPFQQLDSYIVDRENGALVIESLTILNLLRSSFKE